MDDRVDTSRYSAATKFETGSVHITGVALQIDRQAGGRNTAPEMVQVQDVRRRQLLGEVYRDVRSPQEWAAWVLRLPSLPCQKPTDAAGPCEPRRQA